jgi:hypothetical protein
VAGGQGQVLEVRSQNEKHPSAFCPLLTADCLLRLREAGWRGLFGGMTALDKMSRRHGKKELVTLRIGGTTRECL